MRNLLLIVCFAFLSCQKEVTIKFTCEEIRMGSLSNTFIRPDTIKYNEDVIAYHSTIDPDPKIRRKWIFPEINSQDIIANYRESKREYTTKLLASKRVEIGAKEFTIYKYIVDDKGSEDEESNKFYCIEFGVILETYWRSSYVKAIEYNGENKEDLARLTEEIINDERFMWCSN